MRPGAYAGVTPPAEHAEFDVETYSEAGYIWNPETRKWLTPPGARLPGIKACGTAAYAEHPTTDILTLSYRLPTWWPTGGVIRRWRPGLPNPQDLFDYLAAGGLLESHKAMFERLIWEHVLCVRYGWPPLPVYQQRCSMAKARVTQYPGPLGELSNVLRLPTPKDAEGTRLLKKFSMPRNPTVKDPRTRILPSWMPGALEQDRPDFEHLERYCDTDIIAERQASERMPDLTPEEIHFWLIDQEINYRGLGIDRKGVRDCIVLLQLVFDQYGAEFQRITGLNVTQLQATAGWLAANGVHMPDMKEETITATLARLAPHPPSGMYLARRVLEIRQITGSASVKKIFSMDNQACRDDRLRDLLQHHGARTGRPTGEGPQPLNLPRDGPKLATCASCLRPFHPRHTCCPWCSCPERVAGKPKWSVEMVDHVLEIVAHHSLELVEWFFGDALDCISGCVRGLFVARPGYEFIASDYSAIEAVVTAMLSGEEWRIQAFRENKPIYLLSAAKITGRTLEEYEAYKEANGDHHPDRQKIGKVAELGLGFGGWIGAWLQFDDSGTFSDDEIKQLILAWRRESPAIVEFWGGQYRGRPWDVPRIQEYFGVEGHAVLALLHPGITFTFRGIAFETRDVPAGTRALIVRLPSGRELTYHNAALSPSPRDSDAYAITYWTWNTNTKYGPKGWTAMSTYGGRLTENIVQAVAHDIIRFAIINLRAAGYPTVLPVYDEVVAEIPIGTGSLEEFERIMMLRPAWAADWPIIAAGGWRGRRYRKG